MDKAGAFTMCSSATSHGRRDSPERTTANFVNCLDTNSGKRNTKKWSLSIKNGGPSKPHLDQSQQMGLSRAKAAIMSLHPLCQWPSVAWLIKRTRKIISKLLCAHFLTRPYTHTCTKCWAEDQWCHTPEQQESLLLNPSPHQSWYSYNRPPLYCMT